VTDLDRVPATGCFQIGHHKWLALRELTRWCHREGLQMPLKQIAQQLKSTGWQSRSFTTDVGSERMVWTNKRVY